MRVNELAKEVGKTPREVMDLLEKNHIKKSALSGLTSEEERLVRSLTEPKKEEALADGAGHKKKVVAVYRPQNSQQLKSRPASQKNTGVSRPAGRPAEAPKAEETVKSQEIPAEKPAEAVQEPVSAPTNSTERSAQGRDSQRDNRQGSFNRDGQGNRQGSFNRDGQRDNRQGSFNRDGQRDNRQGGFNRDGQGNRQGSFNRDGQRDNRQGGFNRDGQRDNRQGGFNRDGQRDNRQGGFNRDGQRDNRQGGFNRDGQRDNRQGGFNRDGQRDNRQGGFNRDGQRDNRQGGFNRDGQGNRQGGSGRSQSSKSSFDTPVQTKPSSNRQNKNAHKNDRFDKRDRVEDGKAKSGLKGGKPQKGAFIMPVKKEEAKVETVKVITLPDTITIRDLADKMKLQPSAIVKKLFLQGKMVTVNQEVDYDQAEEIAMEFDVLCEKEEKIDVIAELLKEEEDAEETLVTRPPVVCVMGHVDHGKTSLLDAIRKSNVTSREAGGITQHIGAYVVEINGQKITFLDTPGHEAFTAMRMRGAQSTDIAVLVVAADDGVMPQTVEAINHAKAAGVEIIVAINKIDKPSANIDRVKQELSEYELIPEDWGGTTVCVPVSAHTQAGIKELLEMILLTAEVKELKANPNRNARGIIIEAELDKGKGPVATVLVQKGTLHVGDIVACGACYGKVRAMMDDKGRRVKEAGPSTPVEILGLNDVPNAGEILVNTVNEKEARSFAETFISEGKNKLIEDTKAKLSLDDLFSQIQAGNIKELPIIIKADVQGSVEAVKQSLVKLSNEEVAVKVIHGGVGAINESDVSLASASNAIIIGFNVRPDATAKSIADREKVDIRLYKVIYQAIEDVEAAMKGMLDPIFEEKVIGHAVVRQTFKASGVGTIAGSYVLDGKFTRGCKARITRDGVQIFDGDLASLKRFKDDVKEVATGYECGLVFDKFNDLQEDDMIEAYTMVEVPR
ncbi:MAG: translation initiation factor IF-2 [Lachnospiraceae bacterium]|jgi:translation initiation factor IF-2